MGQPLIPQASLQQIPASVRSAQDYEFLAPEFMPASVFAYVAGGSGQDRTLMENRAALDAQAIVPRVLRDVRKGQTECVLNGVTQPHPLLLAPLAYQRLAHPGAELETARAAAATETPMVLSTLSNTRLEEVATAGGRQGHYWFQLYLQPERAQTLDLLQRAVAAGYSAIVLTLDANIQLPSQRAIEAGFVVPADCVAANLSSDAEAQPQAIATRRNTVFAAAMQHAPGWADVEWLLQESPLPIWVKGVLDFQDAMRLRDLGVAGVVVSNHGGRTLDAVPASLRVLPEIRSAVGQDFPLLFDGGIRSGMDVFRAIALGADAVLIGRLQVYALAVAGALGVAHMLKLLRQELEATMAVAGCASLADVRQARLIATR